MEIKQITNKLKSKIDLSAEEIQELFTSIFTQDHSDQDIREFLIALHQKGETYEEILGAVQYLKKNGETLNCKSPDLLDCCGTGGDQKHTFNISTAVSFVLAGAGCKVAKHGNKAVSSVSGSADVLSALGVNIQASKEKMAQCIDDIGIGFLFAPNYYPILKKVGPIRNSINHRTIFNILGPLLNPAGAKLQLIGVYDRHLCSVVANVLKDLGSSSAIVVHAQDGMDEFSLTSNNHVSQLKNKHIKDFIFDPRDSGYPYCKEADLKGGTPQENAARLKKTLKGHSEPIDHVVHINAAWGLIAAGKAENFMDALLMAQQSISSGKAYQKLDALIDITNS